MPLQCCLAFLLEEVGLEGLPDQKILESQMKVSTNTKEQQRGGFLCELSERSFERVLAA